MKYECRGCGLANKCVLDVELFDERDMRPESCPYRIDRSVQWERVIE